MQAQQSFLNETAVLTVHHWSDQVNVLNLFAKMSMMVHFEAFCSIILEKYSLLSYTDRWGRLGFGSGELKSVFVQSVT